MELPDIAQIARNFSVMVRSQGPDPKGLKMRRHAFHLHQSGNTTLSASGLLLPEGTLSRQPPVFDHVCGIHRYSGALVVTVASIVEPFLTAEHRNSPNQEFFPKLIPEARVDVLVECEKAGTGRDGANTTPRWFPSQLLALVDVSESSGAILSLVGAHIGSAEHSPWEVGWSLVPLNNNPQSGLDAFQKQVGNKIGPFHESCRNLASDESNSLFHMGKTATRIAILGVPTVSLKNVLHLDISQPQKRGDLLLVMGSPFGILSPLHFLNSISVGAVANCCPPGSYQCSLLIADIRCLPGMEGGPVFDRYSRLTGLLTSPLRQKGSNAEIQLVITWDAIATLWSNRLQKEDKISRQDLIDKSADCRRGEFLSSFDACRKSLKCSPEDPDFPHFSQSSIKKAISSIVLVTVGYGTWASGIVLNDRGLVLTNAHILEPWRFGRTSSLGLIDKSTLFSVRNNITLSQQQKNVSEEESRILFDTIAFGTSEHDGSLLNPSYQSCGKISVRLDHMEHPMWCDARVVYVSKGPLDVALLQLETFPNKLPIVKPEFKCPSTGQPVHVIGHGLLGPRSDLSPSVSSGVAANVVRLPGLHLHEYGIAKTLDRNVPVLLQTTAAVHPGSSGGAVVNSEGHMIGLVTSNARHGGGSVIPHMNFSIPCTALQRIFEFADKQDTSILQFLDEPNELLSSIWALVPGKSPMPKTSSQGSNSTEGKGSRFSKFIAEKHVEFTLESDQEKSGKEKLLSKI